MHQAKPDFFRIEKVASHLGDEGVNQGRISVVGEECNRQADALAADAVN